jgi:hypothetical protein
MNRATRRLGRLVLLLLVPLGQPATVAAHGTRHMIEAVDAVTVAFRYTDGTAMAFAAVEVRSPGPDERLVQTGRTDAAGRFAFVPTATGDWQVAADDGQGHAETALVPVGPELVATSRASAPHRWLLFASLAANIFLAATLWHRRLAPALAPG